MLPEGDASSQKACDLSSLTNSAAHSRASGIFPASRKARAFAKAWLSADRSAADSFPGRALWALRSAADVLRIILIQTWFRRATNLDRQRLDRNVYPCQAAGSDRPPRRHAFVEPKFGSPVEGPGRGKRARSPVGDQPEPRRGTRMATNSVPNTGRAGYRKARDPRGSRRTNTARLPLRTAWTVTLVLSLGLWGMIWLVVSSLASASPWQHP